MCKQMAMSNLDYSLMCSKKLLLVIYRFFRVIFLMKKISTIMKISKKFNTSN